MVPQFKFETNRSKGLLNFDKTDKQRCLISIDKRYAKWIPKISLEKKKIFFQLIFFFVKFVGLHGGQGFNGYSVSRKNRILTFSSLN